MQICGVICEYNPFHRGHEKQLRQIRAQLGADTAVVCVMSGNFVQRGAPAIFDKFVRARAAVLAGASLVLELPVTRALCSAEGFARGGVELLSRLGCVDTLAFGCESGSLEPIMRAAHCMCAPEYDEALRQILKTGVSYPAARQRALEQLGQSGSVSQRPNDILALEYCKALIEQQSRLRPLALWRGGDYHAAQAEAENPSASSLRAALLAGECIDAYVPQSVWPAYQGARQYTLQSGERAMLGVLRAMPEESWAQTAHGSEGLWSKARRAAQEQGTLEGLIEAVKSRRYPRTRVQRLLLCAYLGISQKALSWPLSYARALAFDKTGAALLRRMREKGQLPIVNAGQTPPDFALYELELRAAALYALFCRDSAAPDGNPERGGRIFLRRE